MTASSVDAIPFPSKLTVIFRSLWEYIPLQLLWYARYIPTKEHIRFRRTLGVINDFARKLIAEKTETVLAGRAEKKRDIMSILSTSSISQ